MGEACAILPRNSSEKDELALSALIHTLYEVESYAVARLVLKDDKDPQLVLLMPCIEPEFECLYEVPLPFAEDIRSYQFPPLDKVLTITGAVLTKHRLLPGDELNQAMSNYVDAMDLSKADLDDTG
jgi:ATP-dependent DNA helicase 2 subunit 2